MTLHFDLVAAGVLAPGIESIGRLIDRAASSQRLTSVIGGAGRRKSRERADRRAGESPGWMPAETSAPFVVPPPQALPANERRRASAVVKLALGCVDQALTARPDLVATVSLVFASDEGVGDISHQMLDALANDRPLSPLVFANSVHNAPSGYFSIAHQSRRPSTSLSAGAQSFAAGLLCAAVDASTTRLPVLLVCYDSPLPMPLRLLLPIAHPSASAWLIAAPSARTAGRDGSRDHSGNAAAADPTAIESAAVAPALASFSVELIEKEARGRGHRVDRPPLPPPLDERPHWLPTTWAPNSSALGIAALGLLAEVSGALDFSLGRQIVRLSRLQGELA